MARRSSKRPSRDAARAFLRTRCCSRQRSASAQRCSSPTDWLVFASHLPDTLTTALAPLWQRLLAALYGGLTEELILRFGRFSAPAWGLTRLHRRELPTPAVLWTTNVVVAVLFGLLHLPVTAVLVELTAPLAPRALVLNRVPGVAFGYLFWRRGLESAMLAHFVADIGLQLFAGCRAASARGDDATLNDDRSTPHIQTTVVVAVRWVD